MNQVIKIAEGLRKNFSNLSDFESLKIAVEIDRNNILKKAFVADPTERGQSALEAIAVALGFEEWSGMSMQKSLDRISEAIENTSK